MNVKKFLSLLLTALLTAAVFTACGKWDYSREAVKAANEAQGDTLRVEFKVNQTFTNALRAAAEDNIQPTDVDKAMTMDKSIAKLLTSGCRLDVYALRADIDADQAAAQLADEFVNRLAGCEDEGYISMVKADNSYFYMAVLTYKHGGNGGSGSGGGDGSGDDGGSGEPEESAWVTYTNVGGLKTLTFLPGASEHIGDTLGSYNGNNEEDEKIITEALRKQEQWTGDDDIDLKADVESLVIKDGSGVTQFGEACFSLGGSPYGTEKNTVLQSINLSGMERISNSAFRNCTSLTDITLSGSMTEIGLMAFKGCNALTNIHLSDVELINSSAFENCENLQSVRLENISKIGSLAFSTCPKLEKVHLIGSKDGITIKGGEYTGAFVDCSALQTVILEGELKEIGQAAFGHSGFSIPVIGIDRPACICNAEIYCTGGLSAFKNVCPKNATSETVGLSNWNQVHDISELNN